MIVLVKGFLGKQFIGKEGKKLSVMIILDKAFLVDVSSR